MPLLARMALLLGAVTLLAPPVSACDNCERDGSIQYLLEGEFVRYHRVRFSLSVRLRDGEREWVDTVEVVPMALPQKDGEAVAWSSLAEGDLIEANVRETENDRVVTHVVVVRSAERS